MELIALENFDPKIHLFLLPVSPRAPIRVLVKEFRSEDAYDADEHPSRTAMSAILRAGGFLSGSLYSVLAELDSARITRLRSHKGILPLHSGLRRIQHLNVEAKMENGYSRRGAVISLGEAMPLEESKILLSFRTGILVAAPLDISDISKLAERWMSGMDDRFLSLDFDSIVESICGDPRIVVLRYFAADNGKRELVALIYHDGERKEEAFSFLQSLET